MGASGGNTIARAPAMEGVAADDKEVEEDESGDEEEGDLRTIAAGLRNRQSNLGLDFLAI